MEKHSRRNAIALMAGAVPALASTVPVIATVSGANAGSVAIDGPDEYSPKIAAAFAKWQALVQDYREAEAAIHTAYDRYAAIKPEIPAELLTGRAAKFCSHGGINLIGIEREAVRYPSDPGLAHAVEVARQCRRATDAAAEKVGLKAFDDAAAEASEAESDEFLVFLSVPPVTRADVGLQAKHLKEWLLQCSNERPVEAWLEALTGTTWPNETDDASDVEVAHV
ncbi:hypothetical protein [Hyphomicrobium sp. MC1]|uniref:hypothetical protein n=1 Tax=Hyphomicrobium sp. (strain MC1) TaxID=717785 RepID=UPI000213EAD5|nr:hypothetical protein [Hyphomicrobium sp. MC1]CCB64076.1 exported protein of unknown function [Hyphomicrobium sp. MC1]